MWIPPTLVASQAAAAEQVQVQVKDTLPRILADVPDEPIAGRGDTLGLSHCVRRAHHRRQYRPICGLDRVDACDMAAWNDQRMRRRLGIQVAEGNHVVVAIDLCAGNAASDNTAEKTVRVSRLSSISHRDDSSIPSSERGRG